ncbi:MAG: hypothetical protein JXA87_13380 [Thermoleophilia bacterium]|nr:hypothetical protein [Thermoleophilia bacterium]
MDEPSDTPDAGAPRARLGRDGIARSVTAALRARVRQSRHQLDLFAASGELQDVDSSVGGLAVQPVQEYFISFEDASAPFRSRTHLGTDYGPVGVDDGVAGDFLALSWTQGKASGHICVDPALGGTAGMWHSLSGLAGEQDRHLDFAKCYPYVRDEFQPRCVGMTVAAQGIGSLKLELKSPDGGVLWWATEDISTGDQWSQLHFSWSPADLRKVKLLTWVAEPRAQLCVSSLRLLIEMPEIPFEQKVFLVSYAKLARAHSLGDGLVRDRADRRAGELDSIVAGGLFCLATCAAYKMGVVKAALAEQILRKTHAVVSNLPKARGLLPQYVKRQGAKYRIREGTEYSTLGTSLYYHSMLLAAQMLWDGKTLSGLIKAVRKIEFDQLRDGEGHLIGGIKDDGRTPLVSAWREWGGETALVLLLEQMATGKIRLIDIDGSGTVRDGIGYIAEIQSLFYPDFSFDEVDVITGVNWLSARRALLEEQKRYFARQWPGSPAGALGLYGLSAGESPHGEGYVANGTGSPGKAEVIHPHYVLMSGPLERDPKAVYKILRTMESCGLIPPWGMVESFTKDLEYLPMLGSLNAAFECISAYHLWARATGERDQIYEAVDFCGLLREAVKAFYPPARHW